MQANQAMTAPQYLGAGSTREREWSPDFAQPYLGWLLGLWSTTTFDSTEEEPRVTRCSNRYYRLYDSLSDDETKNDFNSNFTSQCDRPAMLHRLHRQGAATSLEGAASAPMIKVARSLRKQWPRVDAVIGQWSSLRENWDGEGANALAPEVLEEARSFLKRALNAGLREPAPYIASDGEIGFSWHSGMGVATASFLPDGHFVAYCFNPTIGVPIEFDAAFDGGLDVGPFLTNIAAFTGAV